ncbi:MAG: hypothetical protein KYX68_03210 [Flavobacterium sp.]|nr:hypothetical protein [Flavobacterium sp.]
MKRTYKICDILNFLLRKYIYRHEKNFDIDKINDEMLLNNRIESITEYVYSKKNFICLTLKKELLIKTLKTYNNKGFLIKDEFYNYKGNHSLIVEYKYNQFNKVIEKLYENGKNKTFETYTYENNHLKSIIERNFQGEVVSQEKFSYDSKSNLIKKITEFTEEIFDYDNENRLISKLIYANNELKEKEIINYSSNLIEKKSNNYFNKDFSLLRSKHSLDNNKIIETFEFNVNQNYCSEKVIIYNNLGNKTKEFSIVNSYNENRIEGVEIEYIYDLRGEILCEKRIKSKSENYVFDLNNIAEMQSIYKEDYKFEPKGNFRKCITPSKNLTIHEYVHQFDYENNVTHISHYIDKTLFQKQTLNNLETNNTDNNLKIINIKRFN